MGVVCALLLACDGGGGTGSTEESGDAGGDGGGGDVAPEVAEPLGPGPGCAFEPELVGKNVGDLIEDFKLKKYTGEPYRLHGNCGRDKQVVWIILATGW